MKKLYVASAVLFLFASCSKDFLKSYDSRIIGNWYISKVNRIGIGGSFDELPFREGSFTFNRDGSLTFTDQLGNVSNGTWDIEKRNINNEVIRTFQITTVDFNTNQVRSEFYDDMNFRSTDHFVATVSNSFRSFNTHFRR